MHSKEDWYYVWAAMHYLRTFFYQRCEMLIF